MSLHRVCCCGPNTPTTCSNSCDFATSYRMNAVSGTFAGQRIARQQTANPCTLTACHVDQEEAGWYGCEAQFDMSIAWQNTGRITMTRTTGAGGVCCYQGSGTMSISWTVNIVERHACCVYSPDVICDNTASVTSSANVPFCLTVTCEPNAYGADAGWKHTLSICSFPMGNVEILDSDICTSGICNAATHGLMNAGMVWSWRTPMKALSALVTSDFTPIGYCDGGESCSSVVEGGDVGVDECMRDVAFNTRMNGPWSIQVIPDYQTPPATCSQSQSSALCLQTGTIAGHTWRADPWCDPSGDWDVGSDCWEWTFTTVINRPNYV